MGVTFAVSDPRPVAPRHDLRPIIGPACWGLRATVLGDAPLPLAGLGIGASPADDADAVKEVRHHVRGLGAVAEPEDGPVGLQAEELGIVYLPHGVPPADELQETARLVRLTPLERGLDLVERMLAHAPTVQAQTDAGDPLLTEDVAVVTAVAGGALPRTHLVDSLRLIFVFTFALLRPHGHAASCTKGATLQSCEAREALAGQRKGQGCGSCKLLGCCKNCCANGNGRHGHLPSN
mmetsp:Transcript_71608/g.173434  ORF Transcript_71608/g.173434 Transcript_71608/m.173434 type:complete len:236 (+) Transcript_71608:219-926(+)